MIINLTQHAATEDQIAAGVIEPSPADKAEIAKLLTFEHHPSYRDVLDRADELGFLAERLLDAHFASLPKSEQELERSHGSGYHAMIGGAPYLMAPLERELSKRNICALYSFSRRESVEEIQPDGSVRKVAVFRHTGFVSPYLA